MYIMYMFHSLLQHIRLFHDDKNTGLYSTEESWVSVSGRHGLHLSMNFSPPTRKKLLNWLTLYRNKSATLETMSQQTSKILIIYKHGSPQIKEFPHYLKFWFMLCRIDCMYFECNDGLAHLSRRLKRAFWSKFTMLSEVLVLLLQTLPSFIFFPKFVQMKGHALFQGEIIAI